MPERDGYIAGVPCWVDTNQPDPESAAAFYGGLFGWEVEDVMPAESPVRYFIARIRGGDVAGIGPVPEGAPPTATWNTYICADSADETAEKVRAAGGTVLMEPGDVMEAGRAAVFSDPEGAVFCVWQAKQHKGARIVNEAGSVNFNTLSTRDVDAAKAFYGAVFGWRTLSLPSGEMWTLPGYGDYLERDRPGLREQTVAFGAPAEFVDVVASLNPLTDEQPAHWSVTFGTDDPDATARKASELGGKVVLAPFDAPWVRITVIADPQGATFLASKFVPENRDLASRQGASATAA
jgi:predicted enzyme related to lactoylglutathione lyase